LAVPGTPLTRIGALVVLGLVRARRGDPGTWDALDAARTLAARCGELQFTAPVAAARAEAAWLSGHADDIDTETAAELQRCTELGASWWAGEIAWWRRAIGIDEPVPLIAAEPWRRMLTGDHDGAAALWHELGCPYEQAIAIGFSEPDTARRALDLLAVLGARAAESVVERRLRLIEPRLRRRGPRRTTRVNPAGLTAREVDVLRLLAADKTNRDIASELVVSVKTVDHHVSAILSKLAVPTRHAAANRARDLGIQHHSGPHTPTSTRPPD
jgi:DNA-binding CsgD family transcriptional regulator